MLSWRLMWRDWRGGELGVLSAALVIAVAIVVGISAFADRLQNTIIDESGEFLAADRVLRSSRPVPQDWLERADELGLKQAQTVDFQSMVLAGDEMTLASVKAVSDGYPLRGQLTVADAAFAVGYATDALPVPGTVWIDSRLLPMLGIEVGDTVTVGDAQLRVSGIVTNEPDRGGNLFVLGPRVLMRVDDLPATNVIQPGSRVTYRYLFGGTDPLLERYADWLQPKLGAPHRWLDLRSSQPRIADALERAESYLLLAGALGVALAGVAIALASQRYSQRHFDYVAMMKTLGATSRRILSLYMSTLLTLVLLCIAVGGALGYLVQAGLMQVLAQYVGETAPTAMGRPLLVGAVTAVVSLLVFALPPLLALQQVPPLRVLRRDLAPSLISGHSAFALGLAGVAALMWWYSGSLWLTLAVVTGVLFTVALVGICAWYMLRGSRALGMQAGSYWRLALAGLRRRGAQNASQIVIFALAIMLLMVLALVRTSLLKEWEMQLPAGTPNHFMINIAEQQVPAMRQTLAQEGIPGESLYPMVRGRLTHIDGEPLNRNVTKEEEPDGRVDRELNLTWTEALPPSTEVAAGQWWQPGTRAPVVSVEAELAENLGIEVGDSLRFLIGSDVLDVTVANLRKVDWETMQPNFFVIFPRHVLEPYPGSYMTSFYLPPERKQFLNELLRQFPTVTVIELDSVITQIRAIVRQVSLAIQLVLGLIVLCGVLVLVASVHASLDSRLHENAILRTLGARKRLVMGSIWVEFATMGAIAGALAAVAAEVAVYAFQRWVLMMDWAPHPWLWLAGPVLGLLIIGGVGYGACRRVVSSPPVQVLRQL